MCERSGNKTGERLQLRSFMKAQPWQGPSGTQLLIDNGRASLVRQVLIHVFCDILTISDWGPRINRMTALAGGKTTSYSDKPFIG